LITNKLIYSFHQAVKFVNRFIGSNIVEKIFLFQKETQIIYLGVIHHKNLQDFVCFHSRILVVQLSYDL
tara:strand:+ start:386 stop:592 length:207 start_codon:yes stop_codon:yes gene_type:complete